MRKIGYIIKYSKSEKMGLLVYENIKPLDYKLSIPILFTDEQCISVVSSGNLAYFDIDDNQKISGIEMANIFNFDRNLVVEIANIYESKGLEKGEIISHISFQDLTKLRSCVNCEAGMSKNDECFCENELRDDDGSFENECVMPRFGVSVCSYDSDEYFGEEDDNDDIDVRDYMESLPSLPYELIKVPENIVEEYNVFCKISSYKQYQNFNYAVIIDILDIELWIPDEINNFETYYGNNAKEFNDLFTIFYRIRKDVLWGYNIDLITNRCYPCLSEEDLKSICPHLFKSSLESHIWIRLLNNLEDGELLQVFKANEILQPILPESFLKKNLDLLSLDYDFPSESVAESYLVNAIAKINTSASYIYFENHLQSARTGHLAKCEYDYFNLNKFDSIKISIFLNCLRNRLPYVRKDVITKVLKCCNSDILSYLWSCINNDDLECVLKLGKCFDDIESLVICDVQYYDLILDRISSSIGMIPTKLRPFLDSYIECVLKQKIKNDIRKQIIAPSTLKYIMDSYPLWIEKNNFKIILKSVDNPFSLISDLEELKIAYQEDFISSEQFEFLYLKLSEDMSGYQCLKDLFESIEIRMPKEIQLYILRKYLKSVNLPIAQYYNIKRARFYSYSYGINTINDFLAAIKTETAFDESKKGGLLFVSVVHEIHNDIISSLSDDECWSLFELGLLYSPGERNIEIKLLSAYKNIRMLEEDFYSQECFQLEKTEHAGTA